MKHLTPRPGHIVTRFVRLTVGQASARIRKRFPLDHVSPMNGVLNVLSLTCRTWDALIQVIRCGRGGCWEVCLFPPLPLR